MSNNLFIKKIKQNNLPEKETENSLAFTEHHNMYITNKDGKYIKVTDILSLKDIKELDYTLDKIPNKFYYVENSAMLFFFDGLDFKPIGSANSGVNGINLGSGAKIFKGSLMDGTSCFKSIKAGDNIIVSEGTDEITIQSNLTGECSSTVTFNNSSDFQFENIDISQNGATLKKGKEILGKSILFDGSTYGFIRNNEKIPVLKTWTVEFFIYHTGGYSTYEDLLTGAGGSETYFPLFTNGKVGLYNTGFYSKNIVPEKKLHHIALTCDGTEVRIYINGELDNSMKASPTIHPTTFGAISRGGSEVFRGDIYRLKLWDKAQTQQEINDLMYNTDNDEHLLLYFDATKMNGKVCENVYNDTFNVDFNKDCNIVNNVGDKTLVEFVKDNNILKFKDNTLLDTANWFQVNAINIKYEKPYGTDIKCLITNNNKDFFKREDKKWVKVDIKNIQNEGMNLVDIQTILTNYQWDNFKKFGFAFSLSSINPTKSPTISAIDFNVLQGKLDTGKVGAKFVDESKIGENNSLFFDGNNVSYGYSSFVKEWKTGVDLKKDMLVSFRDKFYIVLKDIDMSTTSPKDDKINFKLMINNTEESVPSSGTNSWDIFEL